MNTHKCVAARFSETLGSMAVTGDHAPASFPRCAHPCPASTKIMNSPKKPRMAAGMQRMPLDRPTTNTKNHVTTASAARMGAKRIFKRKRISISLQFCLFLLSAYRKLPCPARMPDRKKSRGGLPRSKPPRMG